MRIILRAVPGIWETSYTSCHSTLGGNLSLSYPGETILHVCTRIPILNVSGLDKGTKFLAGGAKRTSAVDVSPWKH